MHSGELRISDTSNEIALQQVESKIVRLKGRFVDRAFSNAHQGSSESFMHA